MKTINPRGVMPGTMLIATAVASVLLAACAAAPVKPDGAAEARNKLTQLQSDPNLASRAPVAMKEADTAVRVAEQPQADQELGAYRVYLADRKVEIARAQAETESGGGSACYAQRPARRCAARRSHARSGRRARRRCELGAGCGEFGAGRGELEAASHGVAATDRRTAGQADGPGIGADTRRCVVRERASGFEGRRHRESEQACRLPQ